MTAPRADDDQGGREHEVGAGADAVPRILCVDDEPAMLAILSRALGSRFEVITLEDPVAALLLLERGSDFSVVISDMRMPQMDGAQFLARVKKVAPSATRLALTACLERELTSDEVFGILTKPCPVKLLHESVTAAVQHHALLQRTEAVTPPESFGASGLLHAELPNGVTASEIRARAAELGPPDDVLPVVTSHAGGARLYLQLLGRYAELGPRATLLGRAPECGIVVNDPRIEPRHARFFNSWRGVTLQDLSRANDVRLNGQAFTGVRHISVGDWISVGPFHAEVRSQRDVDASVGPVASPRPRLDRAVGQDRPSDAAGGPLALLGAVAEKFFLLGQSGEAERLLRPRLEDLERRCRQTPRSSQNDLDTAVTLAARLAIELCAPAWIDYIFRVFTSLARPLDPSRVQLLQEVMRRVPGASLGAFREYLRVLVAAQGDFSLAEQVSMRRIQELEPLLR